MKRLCILMLIVAAIALPLTAGTTLAGISGYIVAPSADVTSSSQSTSVTTSYSAAFSSGGAVHIPALQLAFNDTFETSLAVDIAGDTDLLLNAKWRFKTQGETSFAAGLTGQLSGITKTNEAAAQLYLASSFSSSIMDFPSRTTLLLGYSITKNLNSNINFALAFQTPFFPQTFKDKVEFLLDFGNVSYSSTPSVGNAENRGLVNIALRLVPIEFVTSTYLSMDLRALDLFDDQGRAVSIGATISFRP